MSLETMMEAAGQFPQHLQDGTAKALQADLPEGPFDNAVVIGMGGSSIGGTLATRLVQKQADIPIQVVRDHTVPGFVGDGTLVLATSYSGQTWETLDAVQDAIHRGAELVALTTGGRLGYMADQADATMVTVPTGFQPRAAIGYLFALNYGVLSRVLDVGDPDAVSRTGKRLEERVGRLADPEGPAAYMAEALDDGTIGVLGHDVLGAVAYRWATQFSENSKRLAFHGEMPEAAHNQVCGWDGEAGNATLVLIRRQDESNLEAARMSFMAERANNADGPVVECRVEGDDIDQVLEAILVGDHVSLHLARLEGIDPEPVDTISDLKGRLRGWS